MGGGGGGGGEEGRRGPCITNEVNILFKKGYKVN